MKELKEFLVESLMINEFKQDLKPQTIIVMGGPGAGKTYWMEKEAKSFFKRNGHDYKRLDSDHNLEVVQRENCKRVAFEIMNNCRTDSRSPFRTQGETFYNLIQDLQKDFDETSKKNGSPLTELSKIELKWCKPWLKRYTEAVEDYKQAVYDEYERAFFKEYFHKIFASDFSKRHISKAAYAKDMVKKLHNVQDVEGASVLLSNDTIVAITGDKISKIEEIVSLTQGTSVVVVYLNIPEEISVAQDAKRSRSVGPQMIHDKLEGIHKTWEELVRSYDERGIFRMYELVPSEQSLKAGKIIGWEIKKQYINKSLIG